MAKRLAATLAALICCAATPAMSGQQAIGDRIDGVATVIDGQSLVIDGWPIRLFGLAGPALDEICPREVGLWQCGAAAKDQLRFWTYNRLTRCVIRTVDAAGYQVSICYAAGKDLGAELVGNGYAAAAPQESDRYVSKQVTAQRHRLGLWAVQAP